VSGLSDAAGPDIANRRGCRYLGPATQNRQRSRYPREVSIEHVRAPLCTVGTYTPELTAQLTRWLNFYRECGFQFLAGRVILA
jgi:hypothetical protein